MNGNVPNEYEYKGMYWYDYHGPMYSLLRAKMMIRLSENTSGPLSQLAQCKSATTATRNPTKDNQEGSKEKKPKKEKKKKEPSQ